MKLKLLAFIFFSVILLQNTAFSAEDIRINFTKAPNAPYLIGTPSQNINSDEYSTIILKIKSQKDTTARLLWGSSYYPQISEQTSILFSINSSTDYKTYYLNIRSRNPNWIGYVSQIIIFPESGLEGFNVTSANASTGGFYSTLMSGIQEFLGPQGRAIIGSTINTMQSPMIFGTSIFVYIYWIIGFSLAGILLFETNIWLSKKKRPNYYDVILNIFRKTFYFIAIFWVLLAFSDLYSNWQEIKKDMIYYGKTQNARLPNWQEKLKIANTGDFYPFIQFCQKELDPNSYFDFRIPPVYNDIKAIYYLYPRQYQKGSDYIVVYDAQPESAIFDKYVVWKKFRDGAYILKKR